MPRPLPGAASGVTDEDRNRYGALLDRAAERGLLTPVEYEVRLAALAEATSVDELQTIVTELPAFGGTTAATPGTGRSSSPTRGTTARGVGSVPPADLDSALWASLTPASARKPRGNPWLILIVVIVVLIVALVTLGLVAAHFSHTHPAGAAGVAGSAVSRFRL